MTAGVTYADSLRDELGGLIDAIDLDDMQKRFLRSRWLDQVIWLEKKAAEAQRRYYRLRVTTVVGAVVVPALVGLQTVGGGVGDAMQIAAVVLSLVVAVCAAVEQFFRFGERWQHYRSTAETLKSEGWLYCQRAGPYGREGMSYAALFPAFAARVEDVLQNEVKVYVTEVAAERRKDGPVRPDGQPA